MSPQIKVDPEALEGLSTKIRAEINDAGQVAHQAATRADVTTGAAPLDAALGGLNQRWRGRMDRDEQIGDHVAHAVAVAAEAYRHADAAAIPKGVAGGGDAA